MKLRRSVVLFVAMVALAVVILAGCLAVGCGGDKPSSYHPLDKPTEVFWDTLRLVWKAAFSGDQATPTEPTTIAPPASPGLLTGSGDGPLRPVAFRNLGTVAYTVSVHTFVPLNPADSPVPSAASTVVFPGGGNSSAYLSLPLGTYTWCYSWAIGDYNGDGMIEYSHAFDDRLVILDESDSDDPALAEIVDLSAPADFGAIPGLCPWISPFIVEKRDADIVRGSIVGLGHDTDYVVLRGPITVAMWYHHAAQQIGPGVPGEKTAPTVHVIPAGESEKFYLAEYTDEHPGDWNMYIWLLSIDE